MLVMVLALVRARGGNRRRHFGAAGASGRLSGGAHLRRLIRTSARAGRLRQSHAAQRAYDRRDQYQYGGRPNREFSARMHRQADSFSWLLPGFANRTQGTSTCGSIG